MEERLEQMLVPFANHIENEMLRFMSLFFREEEHLQDVMNLILGAGISATRNMMIKACNDDDDRKKTHDFFMSILEIINASPAISNVRVMYGDTMQ